MAAMAAGLVADRLVRRSEPGAWVRSNFRGRDVSLRGGPALVAGGLAGALLAREPRLAALVAGVGVVGSIDDHLGGAHARGLAGHWRALRSGTLTTGGLKVLGLGILAACSSPRRVEGQLTLSRSDFSPMASWALDVVLIAGYANLVNLLDLRPGRALKATGLLLLPGLTRPAARPGAAAVLAAAAVVAPGDLAEVTMLGDCGANTAGAAAGWLLARSLRLPARLVAAGGVVGLTLVSERWSFSRVIDETPLLAALDGLGRRA